MIWFDFPSHEELYWKMRANIITDLADVEQTTKISVEIITRQNFWSNY